MFVKSVSELEEGMKACLTLSLDKFHLEEKTINVSSTPSDNNITVRCVISHKVGDKQTQSKTVKAIKELLSNLNASYTSIQKSDINIVTVEIVDKPEKLFKFCNEKLLKMINTAWGFK